MDVLIIEEKAAETAGLAARLRASGCTVQRAATPAQAMRLVHLRRFDLLIAALMIGEESTLGVAVAAQYHNPEIATILLSDARIFAQGELFGMLSSLRCVLGKPAPVQDLLDIAGYLMEEAEARGCAGAERRPVAYDPRVTPRRVRKSLASGLATRLSRPAPRPVWPGVFGTGDGRAGVD